MQIRMPREKLVTLATRIADMGALMPHEDNSVLLQLGVCCARLGSPSSSILDQTLADIFGIESKSNPLLDQAFY